MRNPFEQSLIEPILRTLVEQHGLGAEEGLGIVVPHRAQGRRCGSRSRNCV